MSNTDTYTIKVTSTGPSSCSDLEGAIDADVTITVLETVTGETYGGDEAVVEPGVILGGVTLVPSDRDGVLGPWGLSPDYWLSDLLRHLPTEILEKIPGRVRAAVRRQGAA